MSIDEHSARVSLAIFAALKVRPSLTSHLIGLHRAQSNEFEFLFSFLLANHSGERRICTENRAYLKLRLVVVVGLVLKCSGGQNENRRDKLR